MGWGLSTKAFTCLFRRRSGGRSAMRIANTTSGPRWIAVGRRRPAVAGLGDTDARGAGAPGVFALYAGSTAMLDGVALTGAGRLLRVPLGCVLIGLGELATTRPPRVVAGLAAWWVTHGSSG